MTPDPLLSEETSRERATVAALHRYPVKSMRGERLDAATVGARGIAGDRGYALVDEETGHVASAKHPRKWGMLLECSARYLEEPRHGEPPPPIEITLPDGRRVGSRDPWCDAMLGELLGRRVRLVAEAPPEPTREANRASAEELDRGELIREEPMGLASPPGTFFDHAPVHIITTATLRWLAGFHREGHFDPRRFRPNVIIETDADGPIESAWAGEALRIGLDLELHLIDPTPRCVVTTLPQDGLPLDRGILRTIAAHSAAPSATIAPGVMLPGVAGIYATIVAGGTIRAGDHVRSAVPSRDPFTP